MGNINNIGVTLKTARESFNKSLFDLSTLTNLSVRQLTLLEENKFDEIGEGVFVVGFLRIYAKVLRINPHLIIEAYKDNYENESNSQSSKDLNITNYTGSSKIKNVTFLNKTIITLLIVITAFIFIFLIETNKLESNNTDSLVKIENYIEDEIKTSGQIDELIEMNDSPNYVFIENDESSKIGLRLVFSQECWIEIRDINGNIVNSSVNLPNSELSFESNLPLSFIFGNADGVTLYISGEIFDHNQYTKVSVARFTISNNE